MASINVDKMSLEIVNQLEAYRDVTQDIVEYAVKKTAKETVDELKKTSPVGHTGKYAKSWAYKRDKNLRGKYAYSMVVYSKSPDYRLTHLLENGHAKLNGGRVEGIPHIRTAEKIARENLEFYIKSGIKQEG